MAFKVPSNFFPTFSAWTERGTGLNTAFIDRTPDRTNLNLINGILQWVGVMPAFLADRPEVYIEEGYNMNGDVYAIIQQIATKASSVPFSIKRVKDRPKYQQHNLSQKTLLLGGPQGQMDLKMLGIDAFEDGSLAIPLDKPNPRQSWAEFIALYETYLNLTGNVYIYKRKPEEGINAGRPRELYLLPSQYVKILVSQNWRLVENYESAILGYEIILTDRYHSFRKDEVIHINFPNPNWTVDGWQFYGMSPLRPVLKEIQASNQGNKNNVRMMKSGGAIGLIHGKGTVLEEEDAKQLKQRLVEMRNDPGELGQIAGISQEIGFTRIALSTDELKPFEHQSYYQSKIANVLGWSTLLLNNQTGAKYENLRIAYREVVTNKIMPDLNMLEQAFNEELLPEFGRDYARAIWKFDYSKLAELQEDIGELVAWATQLVDRGVLTRAETRRIINLEPRREAEMDVPTVTQIGTTPLSDVVNPPTDDRLPLR